MIDINLIRNDKEVVKKNIERKKDFDLAKSVDEIYELDVKYRDLLKQNQDLRKERNDLSKQINKLKKEGKDASEVLSRVKSLPSEISEIDSEIETIKSKINSMLSKIPNIMHEDVPFGESDEDNPTLKKWGTIKDFNYDIKNHVQICEDLGLADFEASANTSGSGFYFLKNGLARLNQALIQFTIDFMNKKNYLYVEPPLLVRKKVLDAAIDTENFDQSIYKIDGEDLCLIGTSEHAILGMLDSKTLSEDDLPLKVYSYSMCFRKEVGSHGINEKGLWRTHQFNKVEQFVFCKPEDSWKYFDELLSNSEEILQKLNLPYRVIECCTGDLAIWKSRSFDLEVYRPTTKDYGEVMSLSNCTDFQARDLNIKVARNSGEKEVLHTLNNTALATSRIMVAILENYQNEDGSVRVPEVLKPYMGGIEVLK